MFNIDKKVDCKIIMEKEIQLLAKIGEYQFMQKLLKDGELYFSPLKRFAEMEATGGIGDKFETAIEYNCPPNPEITVKIGETEIKLHEGAQIEYHAHDHDKRGHIYCMSKVDFIYVDEDTVKIKYPQNIEDLGVGYDSMIVITNPKEFFKRICNKISEIEYDCEYDSVSYFPEKDIVRKKITLFDKRERFSYQNEFRIYIDCDRVDSFIVSIGNIEDIAMLLYKGEKE